MKNILTAIALCLIVFKTQAQEFELNNFLQENNITKAILNTAPELFINSPITDSINEVIKESRKHKGAYWTGYPVPVSYNVREKMSWNDIADSMAVGVVKIKCPGAKYIALKLVFDSLPQSAKLYLIDQGITKAVDIGKYHMQTIKKQNYHTALLGRFSSSFAYFIILIPTMDKEILKIRIEDIIFGFASLDNNERSLPPLAQECCVA